MQVVLTEDEQSKAAEVGKRRNAENRLVHRSDGKVVADSLAIDVQGASAELAVSKALGVEWDGKFFQDAIWQLWRKQGHDVGPLEVRSTTHAGGRLILHPKDPDDSPFVLVIAKSPLYTLAGWCLAKEGKRDEWWHDVGYGRPCYYVPRYALKSIEELLNGKQVTNG